MCGECLELRILRTKIQMGLEPLPESINIRIEQYAYSPRRSHSMFNKRVRLNINEIAILTARLEELLANGQVETEDLYDILYDEDMMFHEKSNQCIPLSTLHRISNRVRKQLNIPVGRHVNSLSGKEIAELRKSGISMQSIAVRLNAKVKTCAAALRRYNKSLLETDN